MWVAPASAAAPGGTVAELLEPGYLLHDRVLRPARVAVAKEEPAPSAPTAETTESSEAEATESSGDAEKPKSSEESAEEPERPVYSVEKLMKKHGIATPDHFYSPPKGIR